MQLPNPYYFLDVLFNSAQAPINNWANYKNPEVDKELAQAATMPDGPERYALYDKIQDQILDDAAWVPLYNPVATFVHQSWVQQFPYQPGLGGSARGHLGIQTLIRCKVTGKGLLCFSLTHVTLPRHCCNVLNHNAYKVRGRECDESGKTTRGQLDRTHRLVRCDRPFYGAN